MVYFLSSFFSFSLNLNGGGGIVTPSWFCFNNSETVKAINLLFSGINFSLETLKWNLVSQPYSSLQILDETQTGLFSISRFLVKSLMNKNCYNSKTSNHIAMKLSPITKLDKRKATTPKTLDDDVMLANQGVIVSFSIYGQ